MYETNAIQAPAGSGVDKLHAEHSRIEQALHSMLDAILHGASGEDVIAILNEIIDFCSAHFACEEGFLRANGDAWTEAHAEAHRRLLEEFLQVRTLASGEGVSLAALDTMELLADFRTHIDQHDDPAYQQVAERLQTPARVTPA
jgi:hemerythrin